MDKREIPLTGKDVERLKELILEEEKFLSDMDHDDEKDLLEEELLLDQRIRSQLGKPPAFLSVKPNKKKLNDSWEIIHQKIKGNASVNNDQGKGVSQSKFLWALPGVAALFLVAKVSSLQQVAETTINKGEVSASLAENCSYWVAQSSSIGSMKIDVDKNAEISFEFNCVNDGFLHLVSEESPTQTHLNIPLSQIGNGVFFASIPISLSDDHSVFVYQTTDPVQSKDKLLDGTSYIWSDLLNIVSGEQE